MVAIAAALLALSLLPAARAQGACAAALHYDEAAFGYAREAYSLMYVNESYLSRLEAMTSALGNASGAECASLASNLSALAAAGPSLVAAARRHFALFVGSTLATVAALALGAAALLRWGRELAWRAWLRAHANYVVRLSGGGPARASSSRDPDSYVTYAAGLLIVLAVGLFGVLGFQLFWRPGPFTVLALLNSQKEIGDYPTVVPPGSSALLYVMIKNEMNELELYQVRAFVSPASYGPLEAPGHSLINQTMYVVVRPGQNVTVPLVLRAPSAPGQYKLVVLLYNYTGSGFEYMNLFNQLYFNVSG